MAIDSDLFTGLVSGVAAGLIVVLAQLITKIYWKEENIGIIILVAFISLIIVILVISFLTNLRKNRK
jgi:hypothetical protein